MGHPSPGIGVPEGLVAHLFPGSVSLSNSCVRRDDSFNGFAERDLRYDVGPAPLTKSDTNQDIQGLTPLEELACLEDPSLRLIVLGRLTCDNPA